MEEKLGRRTRPKKGTIAAYGSVLAVAPSSKSVDTAARATDAPTATMTAMNETEMRRALQAGLVGAVAWCLTGCVVAVPPWRTGVRAAGRRGGAASLRVGVVALAPLRGGA